MRAARPLLVVSLPVALALSACAGSGTPAPSTGIDIGTAASSQSPSVSGSDTPAPSTTASGASQPRLSWADGTEAAWGTPISPKPSTPRVVGTIPSVVGGSTPLPWGLVDGKLLSSQQPTGAFDGGTNTFREFPTLVLGERALATSKGIDGAKPGQVLAAAANQDRVVWAESPSAQAGPSPWTVYQAKLDGSGVTEVFGSDDVGDEPFTSTRLVLSGDAVTFTFGMTETRHVMTSTLDGAQQSLVPAPGASDVWAAGVEQAVVWQTQEDGQIKIVQARVGGDFAQSTSLVLSAPAEASGEEQAPLRLLAASGNQALIATGNKVAAVDLRAKTLREVSGIKASSMDASTAGAGGGRVAVHVDGSSKPGTHVLSIAPDGAVQLLTLPATEGGLAVDADRIAVTTMDQRLSVVAVD